jgi:2-phosphoglycerate kinase
MNESIKVILIGGAPGAGKTTTGRALAQALGGHSVSMDDLVGAASVVTSAESQPGLHFMGGQNHLAYFTESTPEQLQVDADALHEAALPIFARTVRRYSQGDTLLVVDSWHIRPEAVATLKLDYLWAGWIIATPDLLEARERAIFDFYAQSSDPERMLRNFLSRSFWYNDLLREQASRLGLPMLEQDGTVSVDTMVEKVIAYLE